MTAESQIRFPVRLFAVLSASSIAGHSQSADCGASLTERRARAWATGRTDVHVYLAVEQPAPQISQICAQLNRLDSGTESVGASAQGEAGVWVMDAAAASAGRPGAAGGP